MKLIHTLLFLFRENRLSEDIRLASDCLKSLEKSEFKTVIVYNQGCLSGGEVIEFLRPFKLNCIVIGGGENVGTVVGRQGCFEYIWDKYPDTKYISELHLDMLFTDNWERPLIDYLDNEDEPMISCGIVDQKGVSPFIDRAPVILGNTSEQIEACLPGLACPQVVNGFTNPCIHNSEILKETGGYNPRYLTGKQAFEDDSMLLGYYYYYGTRVNWKPKVNYNSVVYHAIAGQRMEMNDSVQVNYSGLIRQYGGMGLKHLSMLHTSTWHIRFFSAQSHLVEGG